MNFPKPGVNFHDFSRPGKEKMEFHDFSRFSITRYILTRNENISDILKSKQFFVGEIEIIWWCLIINNKLN